MPTPPPKLIVSAKCRGNDRCQYEGKDMFVDITIKNADDADVSFPLAFVKKAGPIIRMVDNATKEDIYLSRTPGDHSLLLQFVTIPPGQSVSMDWVLFKDELTHFGGTHVDVSAEITIKAAVKFKDKPFEFLGKDTLKIVSKDKP